jgi:hypothetical protein
MSTVALKKSFLIKSEIKALDIEHKRKLLLISGNIMIQLLKVSNSLPI